MILFSHMHKYRFDEALRTPACGAGVQLPSSRVDKSHSRQLKAPCYAGVAPSDSTVKCACSATFFLDTHRYFQSLPTWFGPARIEQTRPARDPLRHLAADWS